MHNGNNLHDQIYKWIKTYEILISSKNNIMKVSKFNEEVLLNEKELSIN